LYGPQIDRAPDYRAVLSRERIARLTGMFLTPGRQRITAAAPHSGMARRLSPQWLNDFDGRGSSGYRASRSGDAL